MATSYHSERSSIAPTDFAICNSFEDETGVISVAVENCQLCGCGRRPFYCPSCVQAGDFCHSLEPNHRQSDSTKETHPVTVNVRHSERYHEKLQRLESLRKDKSKLLERVREISSKKTALQQKQLQVTLARQRVELLTQAVEEASQKHHKEIEAQKSLHKSSESVAGSLHKFRVKKRRIAEYLDQLRLSIDNRKGELAICEDQLGQIRTSHLRDLINHIFTITQVQPRSESDSVGQSYVSELAEARHTAYIRGRWVYTENGAEHNYRIVQPTLPGNGDYSSYINWLLDNNKSGSPGTDPLTGDGHPAYTIGAALTFTTQLVSLIAYFLDVNLPHPMCYSNFCRPNMSERRFNRLVYRLNHNVLYLCFCQRVDPVLLHPRHTIQNLLELLRTDRLGRCRPFSVDQDMIQSIEVKSETHVSSADDSDSDTDILAFGTDDIDADTSGAVGLDPEWERVPMTIPEADFTGSRSTNYYPGSVLSPARSSRMAETTDGQVSTSTVVGGLMTSAAASVTSLWRAATWKS